MQALDRVAAAAAQVVLGRRLVDGFALGQLAIGGDHRHVFGQKHGRHRHRRVQQATRVIAQIEHQSLEVGLLLVDLVELLGEVVNRALLELA